MFVHPDFHLSAPKRRLLLLLLILNEFKQNNSFGHYEPSFMPKFDAITNSYRVFCLFIRCGRRRMEI